MNEEFRIVHIIPYKVFPARLGGEKCVAHFIQHLANRSQLTGVTIRDNDPQYAKGYQLLNVISNSRLRYANVFLYFQLRTILQSRKATHLIIEHPYFGWLCWMLKKSLNVKFVVRSHNIEFMRSRSIGRWWWKALKWYEGWVYRIADHVFFISEDDRRYAIQTYRLDPGKTGIVTYGIDQTTIPPDIEESRKQVRLMYDIPETDRILLFNGALYHSTNYVPVQIILDQINPVLLSEKKYGYKIIICGKGLPDSFNELRDYRDKNIIYAGFVEDISLYFKAADIFLNPIISGGGIKTKAIEALAMNCTVVSTELGAMGIEQELCGNKLIVVKEGEWEKFARLVMTSKADDTIPAGFFDYYNWTNIVDRAINVI